MAASTSLSSVFKSLKRYEYVSVGPLGWTHIRPIKPIPEMGDYMTLCGYFATATLSGPPDRICPECLAKLAAR